MQPYDYTTQVQRPADAMTAGIGRGVQLSQMFEQQKASQLKAEALAVQQEQARIMQADLAGLSANKNTTAHDFTALMVKYPQVSEQLSKSYEILDEDQKRNATTQSLQVYSAINAGQTDVAEGLLEETVQAATNSGDDEAAKRAGIMLQLVRTNPDAALTSSGLFLANAMGKEKFAEVFTKLGKETRLEEIHPLEMKKLEEEVTAAPEKRRLRALEAALQRETNQLRREELQIKIDAAKQTQKLKVQSRVAEADAAIATFDRTISSIEGLLKHPGFEAATGMSSLLASIPGTEAREFTGLVETLKSQAFLAEVEKMKGMGALSENEGKKITGSIANLDLGQSSTAFRENLYTTLSIFKEGREVAIKKYGDILGQKEVTAQPTREEKTVLERRATPDGRTIIKYSDGTYGEQ